MADANEHECCECANKLYDLLAVVGETIYRDGAATSGVRLGSMREVLEQVWTEAVRRERDR